MIKTLGDVIQTQICLQILVQYFSDAKVQEMIQICREMATLGLLPHLVGLLRYDENEHVVHLSSLIIHHFCCFDLEIKTLSSIPGIIKILYTVLSTTDSRVQQTILRICNYLSVGSTQFQKALLNHKPMIQKLSVCLVSGNMELVEGSLMLIHDLAMTDKLSAQTLVTGNPEILKSLVLLSKSSKGEIVQLIAETLGFICSCECLHSLILQYGVVNSILHFAESCDVAVQFWASALLLTLSMISDEVKETIIRNGGVNILLEMAVSGDEVDLPDIATNATKTLVILGFLDGVINVNLVSGLESSIIIDGTEHCPGKQGINLVSLDFINFKYSKGKVIQPSELQTFISSHLDSMKKSDPVFLVTQGDCTVSTSDEETPKVFQKFLTSENEDFSKSPAWILVLKPEEPLITYGDDVIELKEQIPIEKFISVILKENFTAPLIDILLSMPPSTNISKTEELELVEILARHSYQRKAIASTAGFLDYLNELIWEVASLKSDKYIEEPKNAVIVSHCVAALKILHLCSLDTTSLKALVEQGLLQALVALLISLIPNLISKDKPCTENIKLSEEKPPWTLASTVEKGLLSDDDYDDSAGFIDDSIMHKFSHSVSPGLSNMSLGAGETEVTSSNDELFHELDTSRKDGYSSRTVRCFDEVEYDDDGFNEVQTLPSRMRTDSIIVRSDSRNMIVENRRTQSVLERPTSALPQIERLNSALMHSRSFAGGRLTSVSADHREMRRISRSMSISLQQAKSPENTTHLVNASDVVQQLVRQAIMIIYHLIKHSNKYVQHMILRQYLMPILLNIVGCFNGLFRQRIGMAISSALLHLSSTLAEEEDKDCDAVFIKHVSIPRSVIISSNKLEVSNENWFFESVRASQAVSQTFYSSEHPDGWYYEVIVFTDGILQIGWASSECVFNPEKGIGVGDTDNSYGFDGGRRKLWSGPSRDILKENAYGIGWQSGDVVSVLLSWDGELSFWLNGKDLGIAPVKNLNLNKIWFPAVSLSIHQHCSFMFKDSSFRYKKPARYESLSVVPSNGCQETNQANTRHTTGHSNNDITVDKDEAQKMVVVKMTSDKFISCQRSILDGQYFVSYFEVDMQQLLAMNEIDIGYLYHTNEITKDDGGSNKSKYCEDTFQYSTISKLIETVSCFVTEDDSKRRVKTFGCGILAPNAELIITKDGLIMLIKSLAQTICVTQDFILRLIPYVSLFHGLLNTGQNDFIYCEANSLSSKKTCIDKICQLIEKIDEQ